MYAFDIYTLCQGLAIKFAALQVEELVRAIAIYYIHYVVFVGDVSVTFKSVRGEFQEWVFIVVALPPPIIEVYL